MPQSTPEKWHRNRHRRTDFADCWLCQRSRAICRSKRRWDTWQAAEAVATEIREREAFSRPIGRYKCRWCEGYHLTSKGTLTRKRTERQRRKRLAQQAMEAA